MDADLVRLSRAYALANRGRSKDEAYEDLLFLYEDYTGEELDVPDYEPGIADKGMANGAAFAVRTAAKVLKLGPVRYPAMLLARQGVKRSREGTKLMGKVREDRKSLERIAWGYKPRTRRWQVP